MFGTQIFSQIFWKDLFNNVLFHFPGLKINAHGDENQLGFNFLAI